MPDIRRRRRRLENTSQLFDMGKLSRRRRRRRLENTPQRAYPVKHRDVVVVV